MVQSLEQRVPPASTVDTQFASSPERHGVSLPSTSTGEIGPVDSDLMMSTRNIDLTEYSSYNATPPNQPNDLSGSHGIAHVEVDRHRTILNPVLRRRSTGQF